MTFRKVIDAAGVCGGLLGIISGIVPWTYHLSYYENAPWKAFFWIWVPLLPLGALIAIIVAGETLKWASPSLLTVDSLTFLTGLTGVAWFFAFFTARRRKRRVRPKTDAVQTTRTPPTIIRIPD